MNATEGSKMSFLLKYVDETTGKETHKWTSKEFDVNGNCG